MSLRVASAINFTANTRESLRWESGGFAFSNSIEGAMRKLSFGERQWPILEDGRVWSL